MSQSCPECGGATTWDDTVGSAVCTSCGTLTDPSQSVLTSQYDFPESTVRSNTSWDINLGKRTRFSNWTLADQGKEARDKRNSLAIAGFIESLARSFNATGLSPRAINIFRQAKEAIHFRWGRKAKLVAGACLAIALRESNRPDCLRDISFLLEEPYSALSRAYSSVTSALNISLSRVEISSYIPILHQHASSLLAGAPNLLPQGLIQELSSVSFHAVSNTATSLCDILARVGTPSVIRSPTASIACAIFILSLESERRNNIKHLAPLTQALGTRLNVGKGAVMTCYKAAQDTLASLAENVPWLDKYNSKNGRAKVAKRNVVARATKDIVTFYNDSWKEIKKPNFDIICGNDTQLHDRDGFLDDEGHFPPPKRRKAHHKVAMRFLLNPVTGPLPNTTPSSSLDTTKTLTPQSIYPLLTYYLSAHSSSQKPTRLQLLAAVRGGADEISDSELFEANEMESLLRSEEEVKVMAHLYDWGNDKEATCDPEAASISFSSSSSQTRDINQDHIRAQERRSRINFDALARLLNDEDAQDDQPLNGLLGFGYDSDAADAPDPSEPEDEPQDNPPPPHEPRPSSLSFNPTMFSDEEIIVDGWRPTSPGGGTTTGDDCSSIGY